MRLQQKVIIEAINKGALDLGAGFLTHAELQELVGNVSKMLGGDPAALNRNTIQAWVRDGIFGPGDSGRKIRNRLYSGLDVIRLSAIFHAAHVGIKTSAAVQFADILEKQLKLHCERWAELPSTEAAFDPRDFVVAFTNGGAWEFYEPSPDETPEDSRSALFLRLKLYGLCTILNSREIVNWSNAFTLEKWNQKARELSQTLKAKRRGRLDA